LINDYRCALAQECAAGPESSGGFARGKDRGQKMVKFFDVRGWAFVLAGIIVVAVVVLIYEPYMIHWIIAALIGGL
jgi:hypothetical protein